MGGLIRYICYGWLYVWMNEREMLYTLRSDGVIVVVWCLYGYGLVLDMISLNLGWHRGGVC